MKTLILGIGSPFGDDAAGWLVCDKLAQNQALKKLIHNGKLVIEATDRPGLNLLTWLEADYQQIILIDMVKTSQNQPGAIYRLTASEIIGFSGILSSHSLGLSSALAMAEALNIPIQHVLFWGIEGSLHQPQDNVSDKVLVAVEKICDQILHNQVLLNRIK